MPLVCISLLSTFYLFTILLTKDQISLHAVFNRNGKTGCRWEETRGLQRPSIMLIQILQLSKNVY